MYCDYVTKVIYLNSRNQIIDTTDLFEGTVESIPIRPREIVEGAIEHSAVAIIFVHNHPSGDPTPSRSDKRLTRDMVFVGGVIQIKVLDHIIIGDNSYFSFADEGLTEKYEFDFLNLKIRDSITADENSILLDELRIEMARFGVGFLGINHPLRAITIEEKVPCDDTLTELAFMQRVMFVRRAQVLISQLIGRAIKLSTQT